MIEQWQVYEQDMEYSVSDQGRVRNDVTGHVLTPSVNCQGIRYINLKRRDRQKIKSVALMVASTFLPDHPPQFNSVIHLNGDKNNCSLLNLMWRPRNMSVEYHLQFKRADRDQREVDPFLEFTTGCQDTFVRFMDAGMRFGVLDRLIFNNLITNRLVRENNWPHRLVHPTGHIFQWL